MAAYQDFTDPRTGIKYHGDAAKAAFQAYIHNQPAGGPAKGLPPGSSPLGPPPPGTYDPSIDYNASAAQRGFEQTRDDASTLFEQGQQDLGLGLGDLTRGRDRSLLDIGTAEQRQREDFGLANAGTHRQYDILGQQQGERAAQQGIQSQGLLAKSAQARSGNQQRDLDQISLANTRAMETFDSNRTRTNEDFARGKLGLDLGNARQFGGFQGHTILNPLTGQPQIGSLLTSLTRAGGENNQFQTFSAGQRTSQAAANGYVPPGLLGGSTPSPGLLDRYRTARRARIT